LRFSVFATEYIISIVISKLSWNGLNIKIFQLRQNRSQRCRQFRIDKVNRL